MGASLGDRNGAGLERLWGRGEWVDAKEPVDGVEPGPPLAETALAAGFADQAYFTRVFKSAFGMTPGRYVKLSATRQ